MRKNPPSALPMLLCWMAYTCAYTGRYSYNANITEIISHFGVTHGDAGLVTTCFFFAYGAGQLINGVLCRRYSLRWAIPLSLSCSSLLNLAVFLGAPFPWLKYLWLINGAAQSVLWPTLIFALSRTLRDSSLSRSVIVMSTTVPAGTLISYGLGAALALYGGFRFSFLTGAALMLAAAAAWAMLYKRAFPDTQSAPASVPTAEGRGPGSFPVATVVLLGVFAVINNLIKDGLTTWAPAILSERFGLHQGLSILMTLFLPLLGLFGAACNTLLHKRLRSLLSLSGAWYLLTALCLGGAVLLIRSDLWQLILLSLGMVSLCMHAVNNVITSMAPLYMRDQVNSGLLAGILNACCYAGSTISSYGLGSVADRFGWYGVFLLLLIASCVPALLTALGPLTRRRP